MSKHPTSKGRNARQKLKKRYQTAREDAQLHGLIETTPEGALKPERVDPSTQGEQSIPSIERNAVRNDGRRGWEVPEEVKGKVIQKLSEPFFQDDYVLDKDGNAVPVKPDRNLLKENAKVLLLADKHQYERDQPEQAGKAKGATNINVQAQAAAQANAKMQTTINDPIKMLQLAMEQVRVDEIEEQIKSITQKESQDESQGRNESIPINNNDSSISQGIEDTGKSQRAVHQATTPNLTLPMG